MKKLAILGVLVLMAITLAMVIPAQAKVTSNQWDTFSGSTVSPCTGLEITWEITAHTVYTLTSDGAGGLHMKSHMNLQATGTDENGGGPYRGWGVLNTSDNINSSNATTYTYSSTLKSMGPGVDDNATLYIHAVLNYNAKGELTVDIYIDGFKCK